MSDATRYKFTLPDGKTVVGVVHGSGGVMHGEDGVRRLRLAQRRAAKMLDIGIYEPKPGCVRVYPRYSFSSNGPGIDVPLFGAKFSLAK